MQYLAYHFTVSPVQPGSEILMALISDFGFESFDTNDSGFTAYIKEEDANGVNLNDLVFDEFSFTYTVEKIPLTNWNAEWEKNFEPVVVGDLLCIRAPFHEPNKKVKHEIIIMPKMSFGTGHHQTTRLMCAAMFETDFKNKRVLDMGCGTGVLAILAKKLGAGEVLAIDIDEWSVENSRENCDDNNCGDVVVKQGDIDLIQNENNFDIILANINKNVLKAHMASYANKMNKGAQLFLSGFFTTDAEELEALALTHHLTLQKRNSEAEWQMLQFEKK